MRREENTKRFIVSGISLPIRASRDDAFGKAEKTLLKFFSSDEIISMNVSKRSVDARKKDNIQFVYSVAADVRSARQPDAKELAKCGITASSGGEPKAECGAEKMTDRPVDRKSVGRERVC